MNLEPREEWISAYVDGELSADERAEVERWLAERPELRQLHDELLTLRTTIQSLPRHQLERDLGPTVLRRAEQTVLSGDGPTTDKVRSVGEAIDKVSLPDRSLGNWWRRGAGWRRLAWPAVAAAAALAIALFQGDDEVPKREVASAPQKDIAISARPAPAGAAAPADAAPVTAPAEVPAPAFAPSAARYADVPKPASEGTSEMQKSVVAPANADNLAASPMDLTVRLANPAEQLREFEAVLAAHKLQWRPETAPKLRAAERADGLQRPRAARLVYIVETTPDVWDLLVGELDKVDGEWDVYYPEVSPPTVELEGGKRVYRILLQPATTLSPPPTAGDAPVPTVEPPK